MPTAIAIFDDSERLQRALDRVFEAGVKREDVRVVEGAPSERAGLDHASEYLGPERQNQDPQVARANRDLGDEIRDDGRGDRVDALQGSATDTAGTPAETRFATAGPVGLYAAPGGAGGTLAPAVTAAPVFDSLRGLDVDEEEARFFEERLQKGDAHLLAVKVHDDDAGNVYDIFRQAGASQTNDPND